MIMSIIYNYLFGLFTMKHLSKSVKTLGASLLLASAFVTQPALANGPIGEHVNHLQENIKDYSEVKDNFVTARPGCVDNQRVPYDYYSLMHYAKDYFGKKIHQK